MASSDPDPDPFDTLLTLEDTLYTRAYAAGAADGARAGRIEGRIFGLEKGFEKFAEIGFLHGRSCVWGARLPQSTVTQPNEEHTKKEEEAKGGQNKESVLTELKNTTTRLERNIFLLNSLTDPLTFSTENDEDSVADFDDRLKRASAKAKIIERTIGEHSEPQNTEPQNALDSELQTEAQSPNMLSPGDEVDVAKSFGEGTGTKKAPKKVPVRRVKVVGEKKGRKEESIEDFAGSRLLG